MKEFVVAETHHKLLVVACESLSVITAVDPTEFPHASNALAHMDTGGQVIFHESAVGDGRKSEADDVAVQIMKVLDNCTPR
jgi:hypothetical protein